MTRRRLALAVAAALAAVGTLGAGAATAGTPTGVRAAGDDYIACVGVRVVPVATCVREPVGPILDRVP